MPVWVWVLIALGVVAAMAAAVVGAALRRRREKTELLREQFGPEYERVVEEKKSRRDAEAELEARMRRRGELEIQPARASDAADYEEEWSRIETQFEDAPLPAVARADALVASVLADRGYPMESFGQGAADMSVDHPDAVEHYRRAHASYRAADEGKASREDLYEALQHYRALLDTLLGRAGETATRR